MTDFLSQVQAIVGQQGMVNHDQYAGLLRDRRGYFHGKAKVIVKPGSTTEVSQLVALCARFKVSIVPQGGNTGLCGGATPDESGDQLLLCLSRMNIIREVDSIDHSVTVESGVVLQQLHDTVAEYNLMFPLDLGAKGSCQIGGNLSTNAGGINVLRYGNTRELVSGIEVVLPDGRVWDGLCKLRKNNTGYDLKHLFIGAEGTLGIITAAVLKLFPTPNQRHTVFVAVKDPVVACDLLGVVRRMSADSLASFEYIPRIALDLVGVDPLEGMHEHYLLFELVAGSGEISHQQQLEQVLAQGLQDGNILNGTIAQNDAQRDALWHIRESISPAQRESVKNDVSVPVSSMAELLERAPAIVAAISPGARPCPFGHIGDGNIHYNILAPVDMDPILFKKNFGAKLIAGVTELVMSMGGSFSAEHGVGKLRRSELYQYKDPIEIELMRRVKSALDPDDLLNPGKVI